MMQAVEEKTVFSEVKLNAQGVADQAPYLKEGFSQVSQNLLEKYGYLKEDGSLRIYHYIELVNQAYEIVENSKKYLGSIEPFFLDEIALPDNKTGVILLTQNSDGKMSIKLPTDI